MFLILFKSAVSIFFQISINFFRALYYAGSIVCTIVNYDRLPSQVQVQAQLKQSLRKQALETAQRESTE
ncbi:hypothetical protein D4N05_16140 [Klebsiella oxytoca]|nr:hypothetical protein D4N05_16140 [Klebsiella oxytoca]